MYTVAGLIKKGDTRLFLVFNRKIRCKVLNILMRTMTQLGTTLFSVLLSMVLLLSRNSQMKALGVKMAFTLVAGQIVVQTLKRLVNRPRPYRILKQAVAVKPPSCRYSFPSGHTFAAFSIAFALASRIPALSAAFILAAVLVGISRIYLGFHYPTDVLVGIAISYVTFILVDGYSSVLLTSLPIPL